MSFLRRERTRRAIRILHPIAFIRGRRLGAIRRAVRRLGPWTVQDLCDQVVQIDSDGHDILVDRAKQSYRLLRRAELSARLLWLRTRILAIIFSPALLAPTLAQVVILASFKGAVEYKFSYNVVLVWALSFMLILSLLAYVFRRNRTRVLFWLPIFSVLGVVVVVMVLGQKVSVAIFGFGGDSAPSAASHLAAWLPVSYLGVILVMNTLRTIGEKLLLKRTGRQKWLQMSVAMALYSLRQVDISRKGQNKSQSFFAMATLTQLAACIRLGATHLSKSKDLNRGQARVVRARGVEAARVVESYRLWIALQCVDTLDVLADRIAALTRTMVWQNYNELPRLDSGQSTRKSNRSIVIHFGRQIIVAVLPGVILILADAVNWRLPESLRPAAGIIAAAWLLVTLMLLVDPEIRDKLSLTKDFISVLKPTNKESKE
jgi:hypothetical protein